MPKCNVCVKELIQEVHDQVEPLAILHSYLESKEKLNDSEIFSVALSLKTGIYNVSRTIEDIEEEINRILKS